MKPALSYAEDIRLHYDPEAPADRFLEALTPAAKASSAERLPENVPWPTSKPQPRPLNPIPPETDDLSKFQGYKAIVVTYTSAEAAALAALFTPGYPVSSWYEYRHNVTEYLQIVM